MEWHEKRAAKNDRLRSVGNLVVTIQMPLLNRKAISQGWLSCLKAVVYYSFTNFCSIISPPIAAFKI
jgi:hypothetical protein